MNGRAQQSARWLGATQRIICKVRRSAARAYYSHVLMRSTVGLSTTLLTVLGCALRAKPHLSHFPPQTRLLIAPWYYPAPLGCHCEEQSDAAIHFATFCLNLRPKKTWIATSLAALVSRNDKGKNRLMLLSCAFLRPLAHRSAVVLLPPLRACHLPYVAMFMSLHSLLRRGCSQPHERMCALLRPRTHAE